MTVVSPVEREPTVFNSLEVNPSCQSRILLTFEIGRVYDDRLGWVADCNLIFHLGYLGSLGVVRGKMRRLLTVGKLMDGAWMPCVLTSLLAPVQQLEYRAGTQWLLNTLL